MISIQLIKNLRKKTGISVAECRRALEASHGDEQQALDWLKISSKRVAGKKEERTLGAGVVSAYIHTNGTLGAMVELRAETDFVAKNHDFRLLADNLAMQIAAAAPTTVVELLDQPFIKEPNQTISELVTASIQKFGERVEISRFARFDARGV